MLRREIQTDFMCAIKQSNAIQTKRQATPGRRRVQIINKIQQTGCQTPCWFTGWLFYSRGHSPVVYVLLG